MKCLLEIACFSIESAIIAQKSGADRIELCANYKLGGITPSPELIVRARKIIHIPLHVIIRPRQGDFLYSDQEFESMKQTLLFCKTEKVDGIVIGCLTAQQEVDVDRLIEIMHLASPMSVTFHRAIDLCENRISQFEKLILAGVPRVLSSGGEQTALEGMKELKRLQAIYSNQIVVMPGGEIRAANLAQIMEETNCMEFHSAAIVDQTELANKHEILELKRILNKV